MSNLEETVRRNTPKVGVNVGPVSPRAQPGGDIAVHSESVQGRTPNNLGNSHHHEAHVAVGIQGRARAAEMRRKVDALSEEMVECEGYSNFVSVNQIAANFQLDRTGIN